ncbi:hypothetical protein V8Z74_14735 [Comamonas sp. w2-DMI]|uniref:hypothetical protein n=1 Tax=Comamonas sp. w2-DMI TaxID=3126391 RepID=UPI0032E4C4E9
MSSQIYYEHAVVRVPAEFFGASEDQFLQLTLDGDSRTYNWKDQRVRKWHVHSFGSADELIAGAIQHGYYFEGGMSAWKNNGTSGYLKPQQWIRKVRNAIATAREWLPGTSLLMVSPTAVITLKGVGDMIGKTQAELAQAMYEHSKAHAKEGADWPRYWHLVKAYGPDER